MPCGTIRTQHFLLQPAKTPFPNNGVFLQSEYTDKRDVQPSNAPLPIVSTLPCILIFFKDEQSEKTRSPIVFRLFPIFTSVSLLQPAYLQPIITQYFIDNKSEIWLLFLIAHSKR